MLCDVALFPAVNAIANSHLPGSHQQQANPAQLLTAAANKQSRSSYKTHRSRLGCLIVRQV